MKDVLEYGRFGVHEMTDALNLRAASYVPTQLGAMGIFDEQGIKTTTPSIEMKDGSLSLVEPSPRGGSGETKGRGERGIATFDVPHYQRDDAVTADEVQGVREFGTEEDLEDLTDVVNERQDEHGTDLTLTLEHQRMGALKGIVRSGKGKIICNLFDKFEIAVPNVIEIDLSNKDFELGQFCDNLIEQLEDDLDMEYTQFEWLCGHQMLTKAWNHPYVRETYQNTNAAGKLRMGAPKTFEFGQFKFTKYRTGKKAREANGASDYIATDEARLIVRGVPKLYKTWFSPADYNETVNQKGLPLYTKLMEKRNGKGYDLEVQSNPLSICTRPQILRKMKIKV